MDVRSSLDDLGEILGDVLINVRLNEGVELVELSYFDSDKCVEGNCSSPVSKEFLRIENSS